MNDKTLNDAIVDNIKYEIELLENSYNSTSTSDLQKAGDKLLLDVLKKVCKPRLCCPHKDWLFDPCFKDCVKCEALHKDYPSIDFTKVSELHTYYE